MLRSRPPGADRRAAALALVVALSTACATAWDASIPPRTVRLVLAADEVFRFHAGWEQELDRAVRTTSGIFAEKAGIRFETVRVVTWHAPPLGDGRALDHLLSSIPANDADVVVGVSGGCDHTHAGSARLFSRVALATTGCVPFLQKRTPTLEQLLTHELAHVFGAFHPAPGVRSMMRGGDADVWDGQTLRVMRLMRGFDFRRGIDGVDQATREAYSRIFAEGHDPAEANGIAVALRNRGRSLAEAGELDAARERFLQAVAIDPSWYLPYDDLGAWHAAREERAEASRFLRQAAERAPIGTPDVGLQIAARLESLGDRDGALDVYDAVVRHSPASAEARLRLGTALLRRHRPRDAEPHLTEAARLAPGSAEAHGQRGVALGLLGRHDEAIAASRAALALRPDWAAVRANLGYALAQAGRLEEAIPEYRAALKLDPLDARTRYHLIEALMASRRYGEASAEVQRAADAGVAIPQSIRERLHQQLGTSPVPAK